MNNRLVSPQKPPGDVESLVEAYQGPLVRYATRLVGNRELAQDVVQETFLKYLERPLRFGEPRQWASWLYRVTHNRCIDILKRDARRRQLNLFAPKPVAAPPPGEGLIGEEQRRAVGRWLDKLKPEHRAVVLLFFDEGKTYNEICEITGLSSSNVGMILHRSLKRLRKYAEVERDNL
jgi:RNA polymerase sigma factor (sigma-70 family)